jgi:hypothetical protein
MKRIEITFFWSTLTLLTSLFLLLLAWSLIPFSGATLPHILEQLWQISFHTSAGFVSLICGFLAAGVMGLSLLIPIPRSLVKSEIM